MMGESSSIVYDERVAYLEHNLQFFHYIGDSPVNYTYLDDTHIKETYDVTTQPSK